jgi:hypothetical protein
MPSQLKRGVERFTRRFISFKRFRGRDLVGVDLHGVRPLVQRIAHHGEPAGLRVRHAADHADRHPQPVPHNGDSRKSQKKAGWKKESGPVAETSIYSEPWRGACRTAPKAALQGARGRPPWANYGREHTPPPCRFPWRPDITVSALAMSPPDARPASCSRTAPARA